VTWSALGSGLQNDRAYDVAVDGTGNALVTGRFRDAMSIGGTPLVGAHFDAFLAKFGPTGTLVWARNYGGALADEAHGVAVDSAGNAYVSGEFRSFTATFGAFTLTKPGGVNAAMFVMKVDPTGTVLWVSSGGGTGVTRGRAVAVDDLGNVFVTGVFTGPTATFGTTTITNPSTTGATQIYVARLNSTTGAWVSALGGGNPGPGDEAFGVAADGAGGAAIAGAFEGTATFGTFTATSAGSTDAYVARVGSAGTFTWLRSAGSPIIGDVANDVTFDAAGQVVITGALNGTMTFDPTTSLTSAGASDVFVAKYAGATGALLWATRAGGVNGDFGQSIAPRGTGVVVAGRITDTVYFDAEQLVAPGIAAFAGEVDTSGRFVWCKVVPFTGDFISVGASAARGPRLAGEMRGTITIDGHTLTSSGAEDAVALGLEP
jgi:hypothetical protein